MTNANDHAAKRLARLAAVQALYQIALTQKPAKEILRDFRAEPTAFLHDAGEGENPSAIDLELACNIVVGVSEDTGGIDDMIAGALSVKLSPERIEILLRAILRAGAFELHCHHHVPARVIINDYIDITHAFFGAKEPGLINAVLDKLSAGLRTN